MKFFTSDQIERQITRIPGVISAEVKWGPESTITGIQVWVRGRKSTAALVNDIQSLLQVSFDMKLETDGITINRVTGREKPPSAHALWLESINIVKFHIYTEVKVVLREGDSCLTGVSKGVATRHGQLWTTAEATLGAVSSILPKGLHLLLEQVWQTKIGKADAVLVSITKLASSGKSSLLGSQIVQNDPVVATAKAVLKAVGCAVNKNSATFIV